MVGGVRCVRGVKGGRRGKLCGGKGGGESGRGGVWKGVRCVGGEVCGWGRCGWGKCGWGGMWVGKVCQLTYTVHIYVPKKRKKRKMRYSNSNMFISLFSLAKRQEVPSYSTQKVKNNSSSIGGPAGRPATLSRINTHTTTSPLHTHVAYLVRNYGSCTQMHYTMRSQYSHIL